MLARDLMSRNLVVVAPETPVSAITELLASRGISAVPGKACTRISRASVHAVGEAATVPLRAGTKHTSSARRRASTSGAS